MWSTGLQEKRISKHVDLKVPRVGQHKSHEIAVCKPPKLPGRKLHAQILLDTSNYDAHLEPP